MKINFWVWYQYDHNPTSSTLTLGKEHLNNAIASAYQQPLRIFVVVSFKAAEAFYFQFPVSFWNHEDSSCLDKMDYHLKTSVQREAVLSHTWKLKENLATAGFIRSVLAA